MTQNWSDIPYGSFVPGQGGATTFAFYADDCLLHFAPEELNQKQRLDHDANVDLTAMLQVALLYMGRQSDTVALHNAFLDPVWRGGLETYSALFSELFGDVVPLDNCRFFPRDGFYEAVAASPVKGDRLTLYMVSGSNVALHADRRAWAISQQVNSKMHFARTAPQWGLPVPETTVFRKADLEDAGAAFLARHPHGVYLKLQGLAGARNVVRVERIAEAADYVADYAEDVDVLLQSAIDTDEWVEMTVDLAVSDDAIEITNVRKILFAQGLWVGNYISDRLSLSDAQRAACVRVGEYARAQGYTASTPLNCGIDFFVRGDEILVTEINARWTGGLFPAELIKRAGAQAEDSVAFIDVLSPARFDAYLAFLQRHASASSRTEHGFRCVPMGFSPFVQDIEGAPRIYVWQVVMGDFGRFCAAKSAALGELELPTADLIEL
ncbi:MAG: hypothetical protein AAF515_10215 [Pseudomonadota bacterium]